MAGHSKWANIKHRKAAQDAKKGAAYQRLTKAIIAAAKAGGGDPNANFRLKVAIERARAGNVPMDNIERAIKRGTGEIEGAVYEEVTYEGYGPAGVAIMVEAMTDNRNRTAAEIRSIFTKGGGAIGEAGCVAWNFDRKGLVKVDASGVDEASLLDVAAEAGAEDMQLEGDVFEIYCDPSVMSEVGEAIKNAGYTVSNMEIAMIPKNTVTISTKEEAAKVLALIDKFEDHDDVQSVYSNMEIPDEILEQLDA
ncbi:DNA-binding regulatory protein, YebC/PmpR family [Thermanaerovibrio velox DSM 12556]|uniref:Probable transcriptional regulatory protein TheveDRAFT_0917 n=1 Tax=Thermanaerovibrio velox DSM 12556 TaxID=926567 RepID=H0URW4_9BACT|nr:YebC/PmpR family DNA-binding transcriptional regulator [Thermanaerovibrio velox]EHM10053.1 DNA-binding regulatory protein, YebC/PmpR family [Thermanaerovibrio velox DSM 12556]